MIQSNVGAYLKQLVVNQGFTIKEFSKLYGTTPGYMGDIFDKIDVNTSVIRKIEMVLETSFTLSCELDDVFSNDKIKIDVTKKSGRPISFGEKDTTIKKLEDKDFAVFQKEIESLKEQLRLKNDIIASKNELIDVLKITKD